MKPNAAFYSSSIVYLSKLTGIFSRSTCAQRSLSVLMFKWSVWLDKFISELCINMLQFGLWGSFSDLRDSGMMLYVVLNLIQWRECCLQVVSMCVCFNRSDLRQLTNVFTHQACCVGLFYSKSVQTDATCSRWNQRIFMLIQSSMFSNVAHFAYSCGATTSDIDCLYVAQTIFVVERIWFRNVVQHTRFSDSFLFLGYVISNNNLVFFTLKYPFDTEHNDTH